MRMMILLPGTIIGLTLWCSSVDAFSSPTTRSVSFSQRWQRHAKDTTTDTTTATTDDGDAKDKTPQRRINVKIDLNSPKLVTTEQVPRQSKIVYCRCWLSDSFPLCDGTHAAHNRACGDNVGPLIVSVPKSSRASQKSTSSIIQGRQTRVVWGYYATAILYLVQAALYWRTKGVQSFSLQVTSGYLLAAGVAYVLAKAAGHDTHHRLASDTYKRLNLGLLAYGACGIQGWAWVKFGTVVPGFTPRLWAPLFATINSIKGYAYGLWGFDKANVQTPIHAELRQGVQRTLQGLLMTKPASLTSLAYLACTWLAMTLVGYKGLEYARLVLQGATGVTKYSRLSRLARYAMLSVVMYTLKDASDRQRLQGTTFVQLNALAAWVWAAMAFHLGAGTPLGGAATVAALVCSSTGIISWRNKRRAS